MNQKQEYKDLLSNFIIQIENRVNQVYETIQSDPLNLDLNKDRELLFLLDKLYERLEEYTEILRKCA